MSRFPHHTLSQLTEQLHTDLTDGWQSEILPRLPADYEEQAHLLGAFQRVRGVQSPGDLLRGLLAYVLCVSSFRQLGIWAVVSGLATISDTAWRKRLQGAKDWLQWLLEQLLLPSQVVPIVAFSAQIGRVLLVDATRLKEPGGSGDDWRLHMAYDLGAARLAQVCITDGHSAESFAHLHVRPGDLLIADMGYGYRKQVVSVLKLEAHVIVRICPSTFPLLDEAGEAFDVVGWLKEQGPGTHERSVSFCSYSKHYTVRLIAHALDEETAQRARQAKMRKASKRQHAIKEETLYLAGWILLICTIAEPICSTEQVLALYHARWQIELIFKRMKQVLKFNQLRGARADTNEASILALLVAWALQEHEAQWVRTVLDEVVAPADALDFRGLSAQDEEPAGPGDEVEVLPALSSWLLTAVCLQTLRVVVQGIWTFERLLRCREALQRFVRGSPRTRRQQEQTIRRMLLAQPIAAGGS